MPTQQRPSFAHEQAHGGAVAGIDEVGRGPWAGPVVAACVVFHHYNLPEDLTTILNDSKKMKESQRDQAFEKLTNGDWCAYGIGEASVEEIDQINIRQATFLAMQRSFEAMGRSVDVALVDGNCVPKLPCKSIPIIGGDGISISIAAASIIAKVFRDRMLRELATLHPGYGWETNAGYGTKKHQEGLALHGVTPHHRRSFAPIRIALEG